MMTDSNKYESLASVFSDIHEVILKSADEMGLEFGRYDRSNLNEKLAISKVDETILNDGFSVQFLEPSHGSHVNIYFTRTWDNQKFYQDENGNTRKVSKWKVEVNNPSHGSMNVDQADKTFTFWANVGKIARKIHDMTFGKEFECFYESKKDREARELQIGENQSDIAFKEVILEGMKGMRVGAPKSRFLLATSRMIPFIGKKEMTFERSGLKYTFDVYYPVGQNGNGYENPNDRFIEIYLTSRAKAL